jgi:hypothetical protein
MALDIQPPKPAANFAVRPDASAGAAPAIRMSVKSPLPDVRKLLTRAILLTFATLVPAVLIFVVLKSGTSDQHVNPASVELSSPQRAIANQGPAAQQISVDLEAQPTGEMIVSRNARGTIEREETVFSDGTTQITSYEYDARKHQLRITVYNRDGSTSAKSYTVALKKR